MAGSNARFDRENMWLMQVSWLHLVMSSISKYLYEGFDVLVVGG